MRVAKIEWHEGGTCLVQDSLQVLQEFRDLVNLSHVSTC